MENKNLSFKFVLPRWEELPDIDLYMDQLIGYLEKKLAFLSLADDLADDEKFITSTMINNYVKKKIIPAPEKKKYTKIHLAYLCIIITLKKVFTISQIYALIGNITKLNSLDEAYDNFCNEMESAFDLVFENKTEQKHQKSDTALKAAALAYAYKMYAQKLL